MKAAGRKINGFDVLALFALGASVAAPFAGDLGFILETVVIGVLISALSYAAGASRRGMLFLSATTVFGEALVESKKIIGDLDDVDPCAPAQLGAATHFLLLCTLSYACLGAEDSYRMSKEEEEQKELKSWIVAVVAANCVNATVVAYQCPSDKLSPLSVFSRTLRVFLATTACVTQGEDETEE